MKINKAILRKASQFAIERHSGMWRKHACGGSLPYVSHPFEVAKRASQYILDKEELVEDYEAFIIACYCHDLVEDTKTSISEIKDLFGENAAKLVSELTMSKDEGASFESKFCYLLKFHDKSREAQIIKFADRCCNVSDFLPDDYATKYAQQAIGLVKCVNEIVNPIYPCDSICSVYLWEDFEWMRDLIGGTDVIAVANLLEISV